MEIKINKEIRSYKESFFFGLTLRQCICSALAIVIALTLYFTFRPIVGKETISWLCIVGAFPFAAAGFFSFNGLSLGRFVWAWLKSELLLAGNRVWKSENYYLDATLGLEVKEAHEDVEAETQRGA